MAGDFNAESDGVAEGGPGGDDTLDGGAGFDTLRGGAGDDTFITRLGYDDDTILDFEAGAGTNDKIVLFDTPLMDFADVLFNATDDGTNTTIVIQSGSPDQTLTLNGVVVADLDASDFEFINPTDDAGIVDNLTLTKANDVIDGMDGVDIIMGMEGDDQITGGAGADTLDGGAV